MKIECGIKSFGHLHRYLRDHPGLIWALGFPLIDDREVDVERSLPKQSHFYRKLKRIPNEIIANLLSE